MKPLVLSLILATLTHSLVFCSTSDRSDTQQEKHTEAALLEIQVADLQKAVNTSLYLKYAGIEGATLCGVMALLFKKPVRSFSIITGTVISALSLKAREDLKKTSPLLKTTQERLQAIKTSITHDKNALSELTKAATPTTSPATTKP